MNQSANAGSNPSSGPANYDSQLATMREMGITDEGMAKRALEVMGGDVQAAIDLIYSGWEGLIFKFSLLICLRPTDTCSFQVS